MCAKTKPGKSKISFGKTGPSIWFSLAAFLVSLASLYVSIQQTNLAEQQKEASVWPFLEFNTATTNKEFNFSIKNKGIGPALIKKIEVKRQGRTYDEFYQLMADLIPGDAYTHSYSSLNGLVLSPQEGLELIQVRDSVRVPGLFQKFADGLSFKVAFASVYGKLWLLKQDTLLELKSLDDFERF